MTDGAGVVVDAGEEVGEAVGLGEVGRATAVGGAEVGLGWLDAGAPEQAVTMRPAITTASW